MSSITTDEEQDWRQVLKSACADIVCEEADTFRKQDTTGVTFDRRYFLRRRRTIRESKRGGAYRAYAILSRVAIFVFVIFAASGVTAIGVSAVRNINWTAVMDWQEDHVDVSFMPDSETRENQILTGIKHYAKPTYLYGGMEEKVLFQDETFYALEYYLDGKCLCGYQLSLFDDSMAMDSEYAIVTKLEIRGNTAYLFEYESPKPKASQIVWTDGVYTYYIYGHVDTNILIRMAESIR